MTRSVLSSLRLLLRHPSRFFDEYEPRSTLPVAAGVVIALAIALGVSVLLLGSMLAGAVDGTVTMDNPDRPPEWVCEQPQEMETPMTSNCDEPETIERDAGSLIFDAATDYLGYLVIGPFVIWVVGGLVLFGAARLASGTPSLGGTFAVAGWAALPEFLRLAIGLVTLRVVLSDLTITNLERSPEILETALAPVEPVLAAATVITVLWQWSLLTAGIERDADLSRAAAATAVGVPLGLWLLMALV